MSQEETWAAVSLHMLATRQGEGICKNCGQKITKFLLPYSGLTEPSWYHLCVDLVCLRHFTVHTANDPAWNREVLEGRAERDTNASGKFQS